MDVTAFTRRMLTQRNWFQTLELFNADCEGCDVVLASPMVVEGKDCTQWLKDECPWATERTERVYESSSSEYLFGRKSFVLRKRATRSKRFQNTSTVIRGLRSIDQLAYYTLEPI